MFAAMLLVVVTPTVVAVTLNRSPTTPATAAPPARWDATRVCNIGGITLTAPVMGSRLLVTGSRFQIVGTVGAHTSVSMSHATARSIAQRTGPNEFEPAGSHAGTAQSVPCNVAGSTASIAGNTWSEGRPTAFGITAGWMGYGSGPTFRFHCVLRRAGSRALLGTCVHRVDTQAGAVSVNFQIRPRAGR